ncbi:hypothetical protein SAMN05444392_10169 [Seinonella peptonophila]|uniref:Uncharacterized protein n=1 Tax=Seinonella peptonophila TaxID=112248 RepID=A0A1M4SNU3_9BACL|nr:hypothetical protein SAMN05444392_10169 [Seinonella peptonophila]
MLDGLVLELRGELAEDTYKQMKNVNQSFLTIEHNQRITMISKQNILYIHFVRATEVEEIERKINEKWQLIFDEIKLEEKVDPQSEIEWFAEGLKTYIRLGEGEWELISEDPKVAKWMFEIDQLDEKMERLKEKEDKDDLS